PCSRDLQLLAGNEYTAPSEGSGRVDHRVRSGRPSVERKPEPPQRPRRHPRRPVPSVPSRHVLSQCRQEHIPMLIASRGRLRLQQVEPLLDRFPPVLLQELSNEPPPHRLIHADEIPSEPR